MKSRMYLGSTAHARFTPVKHIFKYPLFMFAVDLDELSELSEKLPFFSYNKKNVFAINDRDYLDDADQPIKVKISRFLEEDGCAEEVVRIELVTAPRYFNYVFNPVSFYYCYREDETLRCVVAEVNNTFGEKHVYVMKESEELKDGFDFLFTHEKDFHVSPFRDMEGDYKWRFESPSENLNIEIDIDKENKKVFSANLIGEEKALSNFSLLWLMFRFPIQAWLTMPRILWQAQRLYFQRKLEVHKRPNPSSSRTIRPARAKLKERVSMWLVFRMLRSFQHGELEFRLPDGSVRTFRGRENLNKKAHIRIINYDFFTRILESGDVGFGEAFTAGDWDSDDTSELLCLLIKNRSSLNVRGIFFKIFGGFTNRKLHQARKNTLEGGRRNIRAHYDLSNDMFERFLDPTMTYSCARFDSDSVSLEEAQRNKLIGIVDKGQIGAEDHVLEIGCGWGSLAITAVQETGCRCTCVTLSVEQKQLFENRIAELGLEDRITVLLKDYRELTGVYDRILSVEMLEAVGKEYIGEFFAACERLLKPDGLVVLQVITMPEQRIPEYEKNSDWIQKHIFPGCFVPSLQIVVDAAANRSKLIVEHAENIGIHYARTLREWRERFIDKRSEIIEKGFNEEFIRAWDYYFRYCEAGFETRTLGTHQLVLSRPGNENLKDTKSG